MLGFPRRLLDHLYPAGPGADHPDPTTAEPDPVLGPRRGVAALTVERVEPWQVGDEGFGAEPGAQHEPAGVVAPTVIGCQVPAPPVAGSVEFGRRNAGLQIDVLAEVQHLVDVLEVPDQLIPAGEALGPDPVSPHRFDRVLVVGHV